MTSFSSLPLPYGHLILKKRQLLQRTPPSLTQTSLPLSMYYRSWWSVTINKNSPPQSREGSSGQVMIQEMRKYLVLTQVKHRNGKADNSSENTKTCLQHWHPLGDSTWQRDSASVCLGNSVTHQCVFPDLSRQVVFQNSPLSPLHRWQLSDNSDFFFFFLTFL